MGMCAGGGAIRPSSVCPNQLPYVGCDLRQASEAAAALPLRSPSGESDQFAVSPDIVSCSFPPTQPLSGVEQFWGEGESSTSCSVHPDQFLHIAALLLHIQGRSTGIRGKGGQFQGEGGGGGRESEKTRTREGYAHRGQSPKTTSLFRVPFFLRPAMEASLVACLPLTIPRSKI